MAAEHQNQDKDYKFHTAYVDDMIKKASQRHCHVVSGFLNPALQFKLTKYLEHKKGEFYFEFFGGAKETERNVLFVWNSRLGCDFDLPSTNEITIIKICGSGYSTLDHRSYMGALLNLGINREVIGDIVVFEGFALVFVLSHMAQFIVENLVRIGKDKVRCVITELTADFAVERKFDLIEDTVASNRIDCIVASLVNLSRDKASSQIRNLMVMKNYSAIEQVSAEVNEGDIISIRGYGKYKIESLSGVTRKGRIRLIAKKYV